MAKKLMLITNEDDPHADNANLKQDAIQKFKDLGKLDFGLITFKEAFDWDKFYKVCACSGPSADIGVDLV